MSKQNVTIATETQFLRRRIQLKQQAIPLIKSEIRRDQLRLALLAMKSDFESQIDFNSFDPVLSRKLDALTILLEA